MMIDLTLPEPEPENRECCFCFRRGKNLKGSLIHWPSPYYARDMVTMPYGMKVEPFSIWLYACQWCRGVETKRRNLTRRLADEIHNRRD